ncbi:undecaprenyl-diphosphate phosphatase [Thermococcus atlanticus]
MDYVQAAIIGILRGITEWLPVSSSGQAMLTVMNTFGITPEEAHSYTILIQMGALLALFYRFRYDFGKILMNLLTLRWGEEESFLFYSTLFTAAVGLPLYRAFGGFSDSSTPEIINGLIGAALIATGLMMRAPLERVERGIRRGKEEVTVIDAIIAGVAQGAALIPGISRSGMTIGVLLFLGVDRRKAVRMSFLMAIFAITGALFIEGESVAQPVPLSLTAVLSSFAVSLLMMEVILRLAEKLDFSRFCMLFGAVALIAAVMGVLL